MQFKASYKAIGLAALLISGPVVAQDGSFSLDALSAALDGPTAYTVEPGDTLSGIAELFYGDMSLWPALLEANSDVISDPTRVSVGMNLTIPALDDAVALVAQAAMSAPGRNARTAPDRATDRISSAPASSKRSWMYGEGVARAIRREYLTFESAGRIDYVDPALKEGDYVQQGHVIAYQNQSRPEASVAGAQAQLTQAQTEVAVAQASQMEAEANLRLAERTFQRYATLIQQNSASQQEYDQAEAQLESAKASALRVQRQIQAAQAQIAVAQANQASAQVTKDESYLIAPISGILARLNVEAGRYYTPQQISTQSEQAVFSTVPAILIDPSQFEVSVNIPSQDFDELSIGSQVLLSIVDPDATLEERLPDESAGPGKPAEAFDIAGTIYEISPVFDVDLRNFQITVRTTRGAEKLRDGETVALWIRTNAN